jgi:hypothetical protein
MVTYERYVFIWLKGSLTIAEGVEVVDGNDIAVMLGVFGIAIF